jgi:hypothetical protein
VDVKAGFSEFSYGFALTEEIMRRLRNNKLPLEVPTFPSLWQEGQAGFGYDVHIKAIAVFMQFKLPEYLKTRRATEYNYFGGPYFRFELRTSRPDQHAMLLALEKRRPRDTIRYASPMFSDWQSLNDHYRSGDVARYSLQLPPSFIGTPTPVNQTHRVGYRVIRRGIASQVSVFSEPRLLEPQPHGDFTDLIDAIAGRFPDERVVLLGDWLAELVRDLTDVAHRFADQQLPLQSPPADADAGTRGLAEQAYDLARIYFGCELLLVLERVSADGNPPRGA